MYSGSGALLHCPDGTFDFPNVVVSCWHFQSQWEHVIPNAFKFHVGMYVRDIETSGPVEFEHSRCFTKEGSLGLVVYWHNCAKLNLSRDCVKEW